MKSALVFVAVLLSLTLISSELQAQEQLKHEKSTYVAPSGRFFVNKALPIYFWLSTSPDPNSDKHLLQSETSPKYSNPVYFDTEGYNTLRTPWRVDPETRKVLYPKVEVFFEVYADSKSPVTEISYGNTPLYRYGGKVFAGKPFEMSLAAKDVLSGVKQIYLSTDKAAYQPYSEQKTFTQEKTYTLTYYSVDNVGNPEEPKVREIIADFTPPVTQHTIKGDQKENILSPRTLIYFSSEDKLSGVKHMYYRIDDGQERVVTDHIGISYLSEGKHTLTYYAIDHVGNKEQEKVYEFFLDKSAPIVVDEMRGNVFMANGRPYSSGRTKFKITAVDNKAGVKAIYYAIGNGAYQLYEEPFYLPSKSGSASIRYYAVDNVNNKGGNDQQTKRTTMTYVDLTGPSLSYSFKGPFFKTRDTAFINKTTQVLLSAKDSESGENRITYVVDKENEQQYNEPFTVEKEGVHHILYTGYDNVDNSNTSKFYFIIDNTAPDLYPRFSIAPIGKETVDGRRVDVYPSHVVLFLSATDAMVGYQKIYYNINGGGERLYTTMIKDFQKGKHYTIKARIIDQLGNETSDTVEFITSD